MENINTSSLIVTALINNVQNQFSCFASSPSVNSSSLLRVHLLNLFEHPFFLAISSSSLWCQSNAINVVVEEGDEAGGLVMAPLGHNIRS